MWQYRESLLDKISCCLDDGGAEERNFGVGAEFLQGGGIELGLAGAQVQGVVSHSVVGIEDVLVLDDVVVFASGDGAADVDEEGVGNTMFLEPALGSGESAELSGEAAAGFEASVGVAGEVDGQADGVGGFWGAIEPCEAAADEHGEEEDEGDGFFHERGGRGFLGSGFVVICVGRTLS